MINFRMERRFSRWLKGVKSKAIFQYLSWTWLNGNTLGLGVIVAGIFNSLYIFFENYKLNFILLIGQLLSIFKHTKRSKLNLLPYHKLKVLPLGTRQPTSPYPVIYTADNRIRLFNTQANYAAHEGGRRKDGKMKAMGWENLLAPKWRENARGREWNQLSSSAIAIKTCTWH